MKTSEVTYIASIFTLVLVLVVLFDRVPETWKSKFQASVPFFMCVALIAGVIQYIYTSQKELQRISNEALMTAVRANIEQWGRIVALFYNQPSLQALYEEMHTWELYKASPESHKKRDRDLEFAACQQVLLLVGTVYALMQETEFLEGSSTVFPAMMEAWKLRVAMMFQSPTLRHWWYARRWQHSAGMNRWIEERIRTPRPGFTMPALTDELMQQAKQAEMPANWEPDWVPQLKNTKGV